MDLVIRGFNTTQIAGRVGLSRNYVSAILNAPNFEHQLAIRRERWIDRHDEDQLSEQKEADRVLTEAAAEGAREMARLLSDDSSAIRFKAAQDILDRKGPAKRSSGGGGASAAVVVINAEDAGVIKETLEMVEGELAKPKGKSLTEAFKEKGKI